MTKKHFIALADAIKDYQRTDGYGYNSDSAIKEFSSVLADFCATQNPLFNRERWLDYIAGKCGPNGGTR